MRFSDMRRMKAARDSMMGLDTLPPVKVRTVPNRAARRANGMVSERQGQGARFRYARWMDPHWVRRNAIERQAVKDWLKAEQRYLGRVEEWLDAETAWMYRHYSQRAILAGS